VTTAAYSAITAPRWGAEENDVQIVPARMPYVYGTGGNSALMHKVIYLRLRWWDCGPRGAYLIRLQSPRMLAVTACSQMIRIDGTRGKCCALPRPNAVLCAACHGQGRNFPRGREHAVPIQLARVRLGCVEEPL